MDVEPLPPAHDLLHRITTDVPADASIREDVLTVLDVGPDRVPATPRRGFVAGLAAAAVVLLVAGAVAVLREQHRTAPLAPDRQTTAAGYGRALLTELPLPRGAKRVQTAPIPELTQSPLTGNGVLDARMAWWTVPGSFAATVSTVGRAAALPPHWQIGAGYSTGGASSRSNVWLIEVRDPNARFVSAVNVTVAAHGTTVAMVAQVDTYAIPVRTAAQVIPANIDAASFTISGGGGRAYSSRLTVSVSGPRVTALAGKINATPTFVPLAVASCPAPDGSVTGTFRRGSSRWLLNINDGSSLCNTPSLTGADGTAILLAPSTTLLTDVLAAVGLPANYLQR